MKKLLALLPALALWAGGCGDTCTTKPAEARVTGPASCTVAGGGPVTIHVTPACASCADDAPKCDITATGTAGSQQLDIQVRECDSNKGCSSASCAFGPVSCSLTLPAACGPVQVMYRTGGATGTLNLTCDGSSPNSCTI